MMERKLSDKEIEQLFAFTKKKLVHYYDLQVELVDHLATSIEEEMEANKQLSFEHALQKVYNRFGIFGFAKVVQEREAALFKHNRRIWFNALKEFFTVPKIALTAVIFFGALFLGPYVSPLWKGIIVILLWFGFTIIETRYMFKRKKESLKNLLLTQYTNFFSFSGLMFPYYIIIVKPSITSNYAFAILVMAVVVMECAVIQVNKQVRKKAMELYPEAFATVV